jgi:DNA-binding response OmpR family regulator
MYGLFSTCAEPVAIAGIFLGAPPDDAAASQPGASPREADSSQSGRKIVLVEDNPGDVRLLRESLSEHCCSFALVVFADGEKACRYVDELNSGTTPCPALVVLDLNLPKRSGREVLQCIRASSRCGRVPVVIFTSSAAEQDRIETAALGATHYIRKPLDLEEFMSIGSVLRQFLPAEPETAH